MKVYLGADHRGYDLKEKLKSWLLKSGIEYEDLGSDEKDPHDDYTLYAEKVALMVRSDLEKRLPVRGVLFCGSGVGVAVVANKFDQIRASIGKEPDQVKAGREDDNMNVLVIASDFTEKDEAQKMIQVFLETKYNPSERHERRLGDIHKIEENN